MSSTGMDAGSDGPDLEKALAHPLRQRILERLSAEGESTPGELARGLDAPLANVAYHVRTLVELRCVELVRTGRHRGAIQHHYRATVNPWVGAEQWGELPTTFRRRQLARTLRALFTEASAAGVAGGFDDPAAAITRLRVPLDEQGWQDTAHLLRDTLASLRRLEAETAERAAEAGRGRDLVEGEIALLLFRRPPA